MKTFTEDQHAEMLKRAWMDGFFFSIERNGYMLKREDDKIVNQARVNEFIAKEISKLKF